MTTNSPTDAELQALSAEWNKLGRAHAKTFSAQIDQYYKDDTPADGAEDPRGPDLAEKVLKQVRVANKAGNWRECRQRFDPAWQPFTPLLEENGTNLPFATIIGPDHFLLRIGAPYDEDAKLVSIRNGEITPIEDAIACAISPNREQLAIAYKSFGITVTQGYGGPITAQFPWPDHRELKPRGLLPEHRSKWQTGQGTNYTISDLSLANDGQTLIWIDEEVGIVLGNTQSGEAVWSLLLPDFTFMDTDYVEETIADGEPVTWHSPMAHARISADGKFAAFGDQCYGHYIRIIRADGSHGKYADIGHLSEYPHFACFSDDATYLALNSCHFYNGATGVVTLKDVMGASLLAYEPNERFPLLEDSLRVYAATWIPGEDIGSAQGAFVLAGVGWMRAITPNGDVIWDQLFGSSASSIDYCPNTKHLMLASYSGMLHVYDVTKIAEPGREIGFKPRAEIERWIFWKQEDTPLRW